MIGNFEQRSGIEKNGPSAVSGNRVLPSADERGSAAPRKVAPRNLYRMLRRELQQAGCFEPVPWAYARDMALALAAFAAGFALLLTDPGWPVRVLALLLCGFASLEGGVIAHEAGHGNITRSPRLASAYGHLFTTLMSAMSNSWFQSAHRLHHAHCNEAGRYSKKESLAARLLPALVDRRDLFGVLMARHRGAVVWALACLQGFKLKLDSVEYMRRNPRETRVDQVVTLLHVALWFGLPIYLLGPGDVLLNYGLLTLLIGPYAAVLFIVNHVAMKEIGADESLPFFRHQLATTRNMRTSPLGNFLSGGTGHHVEHHLFPEVPRPRLPRARDVTEAFCRRHGLPYEEVSWAHALARITWGRPGAPAAAQV